MWPVRSKNFAKSPEGAQMASLHLYGSVPFISSAQEMTPMQKLFLLTAERELAKRFGSQSGDGQNKDNDMDQLKQKYKQRKNNGTRH